MKTYDTAFHSGFYDMCIQSGSNFDFSLEFLVVKILNTAFCPQITIHTYPTYLIRLLSVEILCQALLFQFSLSRQCLVNMRDLAWYMISRLMNANANAIIKRAFT